MFEKFLSVIYKHFPTCWIHHGLRWWRMSSTKGLFTGRSATQVSQCHEERFDICEVCRVFILVRHLKFSKTSSHKISNKLHTFVNFGDHRPFSKQLSHALLRIFQWNKLSSGMAIITPSPSFLRVVYPTEPSLHCVSYLHNALCKKRPSIRPRLKVTTINRFHCHTANYIYPSAK